MTPIILLAILAILILPVLFVVTIYNRLVILRNRYKNAFAQIDVQLKRRYDLIPNLVETAKGYLKHERETLEAVIAARNQAAGAMRGAVAGDAGSLAALSGAENMLGNALSRLMMVVEQYPDLKADAQMRQLQEEITSTENKVAFARQAYNDAVTEHNTACEQFPANLIAGTFGFGAAALFETDSAQERQAPKVSF